MPNRDLHDESNELKRTGEGKRKRGLLGSDPVIKARPKQGTRGFNGVKLSPSSVKHCKRTVIKIWISSPIRKVCGTGLEERAAPMVKRFTRTRDEQFRAGDWRGLNENHLSSSRISPFPSTPAQDCNIVLVKQTQTGGGSSYEMALKSSSKLLVYSSSFAQTIRLRCTLISAIPPKASRCYFASTANAQKKKKKAPPSSSSSPGLVKEKRRTRSDKDFDDVAIQLEGATKGHIPVMLAEVVDVFSASSMRPLRSLVDCTVGAGGHSSAIIEAHPELKFYIGMDVDPIAIKKARSRMHFPVIGDSSNPTSDLNAHIVLKNYKYIKSLLGEVDKKLLETGVDGILMDLGMSSMQVNNPERGFSVLGNGPLDMRMDPSASLKAQDILNTWPDKEVGRILKEYGEESNWRALQNRIIKARSCGGLHSTGDLVQLIRGSTVARQGRQGWIKTATRVFQALRIAVNDELKTLEDSLYTCFDCLAPEGRLAVISFHSLEDRVVKRTFLDIIKGHGRDAFHESAGVQICDDINEEEGWIKQRVQGLRGTILTKRPITPSEKEENSNSRSRSAKLRVIQKIR